MEYLDALRQISTVSAQSFRYARALKAISESELCEYDQADVKASDPNLEQIYNYAATGAIAFRISLGDAEPEMEAASANGDPETKLLAKENYGKLHELIAQLPAKEQRVLKGYYFKDQTFAEIATEQGEWTKSWVCRIHRSALNKLSLLAAESQVSL